MSVKSVINLKKSLELAFESYSRMDSTKRWWKFVPRTRTRPATANDRSPNDDVVRGTASAPEAADLRPALPVEAADVVIGLTGFIWDP